MKRILKDLPEIIIAIFLMTVCKKDLSSTINIIGFYLGALTLATVIIHWAKKYLELFIQK